MSGWTDRIEGLNIGADDYISKPFYVEELAYSRPLAVESAYTTCHSTPHIS